MRDEEEGVELEAAGATRGVVDEEADADAEPEEEEGPEVVGGRKTRGVGQDGVAGAGVEAEAGG